LGHQNLDLLLFLSHPLTWEDKLTQRTKQYPGLAKFNQILIFQTQTHKVKIFHPKLEIEILPYTKFKLQDLSKRLLATIPVHSLKLAISLMKITVKTKILKGLVRLKPQLWRFGTK
jgi:hypothetical protein